MTDELRSFDVYFNARQIGANKIKNNRKLGAQGAVTAKPADKKTYFKRLVSLKFEPLV